MSHFSTLKAYKQLVATGIPEAQAEAQVLLLENSLDHLATKNDLKNEIRNLERDLRSDIKNLEINLENKIDSKFNLLMILGSIIFLVHTQPILEKMHETSPTIFVAVAVIVLLLITLLSFFKKKKV